MFWEHWRHTRQHPRLCIRDVGAALCILKIVNIWGIILNAASLSCHEMGKFSCKWYLRRLCAVEERQSVEHVSKPLTLFLPVKVQSPQQVLQRFRAHCYLGGLCLLTKILECTAQLEILCKIVFPVESEHCLTQHTIVGITFQTNINRCSCINNALVKNGYLTSGIVYTVIRAFCKHHSTSCYHHRALRHVICAKRNNICRRTLKLSHQHKLIFLGYLLGCCLSSVIQFGKCISSSLICRYASIYKIALQIRAKWFGCREEHTSVAYGVSLNKVKVSVRVYLIIIV